MKTAPLHLRRSPRTRNQTGATADHEGLDVSSLVDVAFLLLIFFLVTSTLQPREADLAMAVPGDEPGSTQLVPLEIVIEADGAVSWGDQRLIDTGDHSLTPLRSALRDHIDLAAALGQQPAFILGAADDASHQRLVDVLNALTHEGVDTLMLRDFE